MTKQSCEVLITLLKAIKNKIKQKEHKKNCMSEKLVISKKDFFFKPMHM